MMHLYRRLLAHFRFDLKAVCDMSDDNRDYHDYPDAMAVKQPLHFYDYTCERCGRHFSI